MDSKICDVLYYEPPKFFLYLFKPCCQIFLSYTFLTWSLVFPYFCFPLSFSHACNGACVWKDQDAQEGVNWTNFKK
jgi:hypothetical protein